MGHSEAQQEKNGKLWKLLAGKCWFLEGNFKFLFTKTYRLCLNLEACLPRNYHFFKLCSEDEAIYKIPYIYMQIENALAESAENFGVYLI